MMKEVEDHIIEFFQAFSSFFHEYYYVKDIGDGNCMTVEELVAVIRSVEEELDDEEEDEVEIIKDLEEVLDDYYNDDSNGIREFAEFLFLRLLMAGQTKVLHDDHDDDIIDGTIHEAEDELKEAFNVFDKDQDGFISANELRHVMMNLGEKLTDEEVEHMIKEADLDGDGKVNFQEFLNIIPTEISIHVPSPAI